MDPFEAVERRLVRRDLARSDRSPGQREEGDHHVFSSQVIAQADLFFQVAFQCEIRSRLTNSKRHFFSFFAILKLAFLAGCGDSLLGPFGARSLSFWMNSFFENSPLLIPLLFPALLVTG
jgi:hypothetical protein